ncbi:MAG: thioesterase [Salinarimonadaceae bacterium]|nr:MAG: thioesterase [Salinarimonadaceae bacterium]
MPADRAASIFFFAPFVSSTMRIERDWIDYNGHLNLAYYHVLFDRALDEAFGLAGLGPEYVEERHASYFIAEAHTIYRRELRIEDTVRVTVQLIDFDDKRIHVYLEARHAAEGWLAACCEMMGLHVDTRERRVTPFPEEIRRNLEIMLAAHSRLPKPDSIGRAVGIPARSTGKEPAGTRH